MAPSAYPFSRKSERFEGILYSEGGANICCYLSVGAKARDHDF